MFLLGPRGEPVVRARRGTERTAPAPPAALPGSGAAVLLASADEFPSERP